MAHPECEEPVLRLADYIGSTKGTFWTTSSQQPEIRQFIVVTEAGILHQMNKHAPHKTFIPAPPDNGCACNECPHMKLTTMEKLYLCMRDRTPRSWTLPRPPVKRRRWRLLRRMLAMELTAGGDV